MTTLTQRYIFTNGKSQEIVETTHIYSREGHFEQNGKRCGWHIELGTDVLPEIFEEVNDGDHHDVPDNLDDIIVEINEEEYANAVYNMLLNAEGSVT